MMMQKEIEGEFHHGRQPDLHFEYLAEKFKEKTGLETFDLDILKIFGLYVEEKGWTVNGVQVSDDNFFLQMEITQTVSQSSRMFELEGSCLLQIEQAMEIFRDFYEEQSDEQEDQTVYILETAFQEALAKAICAFWVGEGTSIRIVMTDDGVQIATPVDTDWSDDPAAMRDPTMAALLNRLGYMIDVSSGYRIIDRLYRGSKSQPEYRVDGDDLIIWLPVYTTKSAV